MTVATNLVTPSHAILIFIEASSFIFGLSFSYSLLVDFVTMPILVIKSMFIWHSYILRCHRSFDIFQTFRKSKSQYIHGQSMGIFPITERILTRLLVDNYVTQCNAMQVRNRDFNNNRNCWVDIVSNTWHWLLVIYVSE